MEVKNVRLSEVPIGYLMDLKYVGTAGYRDGTDINLYQDNELFLLEAKNIVLAKYPKDAPIEDSIIVHPRYANKKDFELIEVKGYRNGRTIDILVGPRHTDKNAYKIINVKGVGAEADGKPMMIDTERWYVGSNMIGRWKPLSEAKKQSLGRRWGLLSQEAGKEEYEYNLFEDFNIPQIPHLKLNYAPPGILPFENVAQLVRGLQTNIRCDNEFFDNAKLQQKINAKAFSDIDAKIFFVQKELFKEGKTITGVGRIANNRYIDGRLTDMENYVIKKIENENDLITLSGSLCHDLMGSAMIAMRKHKPGRIKYLKQLEEQTGILVTAYSNASPKIFMDYLLPRNEQNNLAMAVERTMRAQIFKERFIEFLKK